MIYESDDGLTFKLDTNNFTAKVVNLPGAKAEVEIPRSINYESKEYKITTISEGAFDGKNIKSIFFPENSELQTIEKGSFSTSTVQNISLPSSLKELQKDWCANTWQLIHISISPKNKLFTLYKDQIIIGKSQPDTDCYDVLYFACRNITNALIPSSIRIISSYAFSGCRNLKNITFEKNSELRLIEENAFSSCSVEKIEIPTNVSEIKDRWCRFTWYLNEISISPMNQNFKYVDLNKKMVCRRSNPSDNRYEVLIFASRNIEKAFIPSHITEIEPYAFANCQNLNQFEIEENSNLRIIGEFSFLLSSIKKITIPRYVRKIGEKAFNGCMCLEKVEFSKESELHIIEKSAFENSVLEEILIPSNVEKIEDESFFHCIYLEKVEFEKDSKLTFIGQNVFTETMIKKFTFPTHLVSIGKRAFSNIYENLTVDFVDDSELTTFEEETFCDSPLVNLTFPKNLINLQIGWCCCTPKLVSISISPENTMFSKMKENEKIIVGKTSSDENCYNSIVFACRDVQNVTVPSYIENIKSFSFHMCRKLGKIDFEENSKLTSIEDGAFYVTPLEEITIPSSVKTIGERAFMCEHLRKVEFGENSQIESIGNKSFDSTLIPKVVLPKSVKKIGKYAFNDCQFVKTVEIFSEKLSVEDFLCNNSVIFCFPEAREISFTEKAFATNEDECFLFVFPGSKLIKIEIDD